MPHYLNVGGIGMSGPQSTSTNELVLALGLAKKVGLASAPNCLFRRGFSGSIAGSGDFVIGYMAVS